MARVLLTEDDDAVRAFVKRALELDGHSVTAVADGSEAAEALNNEQGAFDLLLSDIRMPEMDGIALAMQTSQRYPGLPILLMTGYADQRERSDELNGAVRDVLTKPFSLVEIRSAVSDALADVAVTEKRRLYA
ncbi:MULTISPECIES: response regulator [Pseudovibrio]|uniref:response regulator n=1 Tax=Stappiaceae TaxID=2821832 RepID=UPI002365081B|nr:MULTISPECIES: response regulator [Pseudovibrio]MDD7909480.1 response regulator [Pseudovibrio exalbescens]MDX5595040.1 response regulator [Pseudovibrio sp. SPO723]